MVTKIQPKELLGKTFDSVFIPPFNQTLLPNSAPRTSATCVIFKESELQRNPNGQINVQSIQNARNSIKLSFSYQEDGLTYETVKTRILNEIQAEEII